MSGQGSVYKRCGCVDPATGRQLGRRCPRLAGRGHRSWYIELELPAAPDGRPRLCISAGQDGCAARDLNPEPAD
jgi:hypothetical protein